MVTVAPFGGEHDARRAVPGVARVVRGVVAGAAAAAGGAAGRWFSSAADWGQDDLSTTLTTELFETWSGD